MNTALRKKDVRDRAKATRERKSTRSKVPEVGSRIRSHSKHCESFEDDGTAISNR